MYPKRTELTPIGRLLKTHGVSGEITLQVTDEFADANIDLADLSCLVVDVDGIPVPFYTLDVRPKTALTDLVTFAGVDSQEKAARLCPATVYALTADLPEGEEDQGEGLYANDMVGFTAVDAHTDQPLGKIVDIDDSTINFLFIIDSSDGKKLMVPVADEFIDELDPDRHTIKFSLPSGLIDL